MPAAPPTPRMQLSLSAKSIGLIVLTVAGATALVAMTSASLRVLGWMAAAGSMAALLDPLVGTLSRWMRRGVAVLITMLLVFATAGGIAFLTVNDVVREVRVLERLAPERAKALEESKRFGSAARAFDLENRTRAAVRDIPERLRGGSSADAIRSAGTRGVAYLATTVMTVFLILNGRKLAAGALGQINDEHRRDKIDRALRLGLARGVQYTTGSLGMAAIAGGAVSAVARLSDVPGPVPLGVWAAMWDLVPVVGGVIGALPVAILAAAINPTTGLLVLAVFLLYEVFEMAVLQKRLERNSVHIGPFLTLLGMSVGLELYGIGGALFAFFAISVSMGVFEVWRSG
ncbi:MAG: AI-2E family transporter [Acidimicrobiales bacterium]|nr:AI-2E family transporter [Acidimicrobiales bacterium]